MGQQTAHLKTAIRGHAGLVCPGALHSAPPPIAAAHGEARLGARTSRKHVSSGGQVQARVVSHGREVVTSVENAQGRPPSSVAAMEMLIHMYVYDLNQLGLADADGDGRDTLADCAPDEPGAFAAPGEASGLALDSDRSTLSFSSAAPAAGSTTEHQVPRGLVAELPVGGASDFCVATGSLSSSVSDTDVPPVDAAYWYLVRVRNACGAGGYGSTSAGSPRLGVACP